MRLLAPPAGLGDRLLVGLWDGCAPSLQMMKRSGGQA